MDQQKYDKKRSPGFHEITEINPKGYEGYAARGVVYLRLGNDSKSQADIDKAVELNPQIREWIDREVQNIKAARNQK